MENKRNLGNVSHPGEILYNMIIKDNNLTVTKTAEMLQVSRPMLQNIVNEKSAITPLMAMKISKVFGGNYELWLRLQLKYDIKQAQEKFDNIGNLKKFEMAEN